MKTVVVISTLLLSLAGCSADESTSHLVAPYSGIIGGSEETSQKVLPFVLRYETAGRAHCTSVQMQGGLILTANHCLKFNGAVQEVGTFSRNNPEEVLGIAALFSFKNQAAEELSVEDDIAVATLPKANPLSEEGFRFPTSSELPETLYVAGYGNDVFGGHSNNADSIPLQSLALSKSKQLLKDLRPTSIGFDIAETTERVQAYLERIEGLIKSGALLCFKPTTPTTGSANHGDSGGPLYSLNEDGYPVLQGIFSTFIGNQERTEFFCYTPIQPYIRWAQSLPEKAEKVLFENKISFKTSTQNFEMNSQIFAGVSLTPRTLSGPIVDASLGREEDFHGKDLTGKIALILRGEILFMDKVRNARNAGALGVVLYNDGKGDDKVLFSKISGHEDKAAAAADPIDVRMISHKDGLQLLQMMKAGEKIEATLTIP